MQKTIKALILSVLVLIRLIFSVSVLAAPEYDYTAGSWTDDYSDATGLSSNTSAGVDVSAGALKLQNAGGTYTAPFLTSGNVITTTIQPQLVATWGTIILDATIPTDTSITIQVLDEENNTFSNTLLSGNESGFTTFPIDISELPVDQNENNTDAKHGRIRIRVTLATTDTDETPEITEMTLTWATAAGTYEASPLLDSVWPTDKANNQGTGRVDATNTSTYPVIRWVKNLPNNWVGGMFTRGEGNEIYLKTNGGFGASAAQPQIMSLNRRTGQTNWSRSISGAGYSTIYHSVTQDKTMYFNDVFNDVMGAYDLTNEGAIKWLYVFGSGHGNTTDVDEDGNIYVQHHPAANGYSRIYSFDPNGGINWYYDHDLADDTFISGVTPDDNNIYVASANRSGITYQNGGQLIAINKSTGLLEWAYDTGDIVWTRNSPALDENEIIYTASYGDSNNEKKVYAIDTDGSLEWETSIGTTTDFYDDVLLRSDDKIVLHRLDSGYSTYTIEIRDTNDGSLVDSITGSDTVGSLVLDNQDGLYYIDSNSAASSKSIFYVDQDLNEKWQVKFGTTKILGNPMVDEDGRYYFSHSNLTGFTSDVAALFPWTLQPDNLSNTHVERGQEITFNVTTSMQETNLITGDDNYMQVVLSNGVKVALSYDSTKGDGDTIWTGTYTIPQNMAFGRQTYTVEATAASIETDVTVDFDSPATDSNNTGISTTGTFIVDGTGPNAEIIAPKGYINEEKPKFKFKKGTDGAGVSKYSLFLDEEKDELLKVRDIANETTGIFLDNENYKLKALDNKFSFYFKNIDENPLTEGQHKWKLKLWDIFDNYTEIVTTFKVDLTPPFLQNVLLNNHHLPVAGENYVIQEEKVVLSGTIHDKYMGSQKDGHDYESVASGPKSVVISIYRKDGVNDYNLIWKDEISAKTVENKHGHEKYGNFYFESGDIITPGTRYKVTLEAVDDVKNKSAFTFYIANSHVFGETQAEKINESAEATKRKSSLRPTPDVLGKTTTKAVETTIAKNEKKSNGLVTVGILFAAAAIGSAVVVYKKLRWK
jgi:hypothetical protein